MFGSLAHQFARRCTRNWISIVMIFISVLTHADAKENSTRIAIVPTVTAEKPGLADLLTTEFSKAEGFELVERAEVDKLLAEQNLQRIFTPSSVSERRLAGALLKADLLLLLSHEEIEKKTCLKVVLAEQRTGARLRYWSFPPNSDPRTLSGELIRLTRETMAQFHDGVKYVIGVPVFFSRALLLPQYDYLQDSLSYVLQSAVMLAPGVAVIETEEATALSQEAIISASQRPERIVPVFVKGEFTAPSAQSKLEVEVTIEISDGSRVLRKIDSGAVPVPEASKWLAREAAAEIMRPAGSPKNISVSADAQFAAPITQAQQFADVGDFFHSIRLREAALLIKESTEQRKLLIGEYPRSARGPAYPNGNTVPITKEEELAQWQRWDAMHGAVFKHLYYLTANRRISLHEFVELFVPRMLPIPKTSLDLLPLALALPLGVDEGESSTPAHHRAEVREQFAKEILEDALQRFNGVRRVPSNDLLPADRREFDNLHAILKALPDEFLPSSDLVRFLEEPMVYRDALEQERLRFLKTLTASERPLHRIYGRFGLLSEQYHTRRATLTTASLAEAAALRDEFREWCASHQDPRYPPSNSFGSRLNGLFYVIKYVVHPEPPAMIAPVAPTPTPRTSSAPLIAKEIAFAVKTLKGTTMPLKGKSWNIQRPWEMPYLGGNYASATPILEIYKCSAKFDIFRSAGAILLHRKRGLLEEILVDDYAGFSDIGWDGSSIWVATRRSGIWLLDADGRVKWKIDDTFGVPPSDVALKILATELGKALAVGSFSEHERAWCAMIDCTGKTPTVRVFHTGTKVPAQPNTYSKNDSVDAAFRPDWLLHYEDADGRRDQVLVGRHRKPMLMINLSTLNVSVLNGFGSFYHDHYTKDALFNRRGELLRSSKDWVVHCKAPGEVFPTSDETRVVGPDSRRLCIPPWDGTGGLFEHLLPQENWIYVPGERYWCRINRESFDWEVLTQEQLPRPPYFPELYDCVQSAHYQFLGWTRDQSQFYEITISERKSNGAK